MNKISSFIRLIMLQNDDCAFKNHKFFYRAIDFSQLTLYNICGKFELSAIIVIAENHLLEKKGKLP